MIDFFFQNMALGKCIMDSEVLSMWYLVGEKILLNVFRLCQRNEFHLKDIIYLNDSKANSLRNQQQTCQKMILQYYIQ